LSYATKTDDLSRFFRDSPADAPGPFVSHVEDNQTEKELPMKTYTVIYAEDVPHYAHGEVEARGLKDAIAKARKLNTETFTAYDPDWSSAVSRRIVSIEGPGGNIVAQDIPLDNYVLHNADTDKRLKLDAAEAMFEALCAQEMAEFDPEASRRKGYFDNARELRKTALAKARGHK
jgi:hypothetical protein